MSGQSINQICDLCDKIYKSLDLSDFEGYFAPKHEEVVRFLESNRSIFTRKGVDFSLSMFIPLLIEMTTFDIVEKSSK